MKKILIIIFIIIFVGILGLSAYLGIKGKNNTNETTNSGGITFREFLPFGKKEEPPTENTPNENTGNTTNETPSQADNKELTKPKIRKIYQGPVAGITSIQKTRTDAQNLNSVAIYSAVRSVNRITGQVIDIFPDTEEEVIVSSKRMPQIHEAIFGPLGSSLVLRYISSDLETVETFAATFIPGADLENSIKGSFLPEDLISVSVDQQAGKLFYLQNFDGSASGSFADPNGGNKKSIFSHTFSEWTTNFISPAKILFTTKPSGFVSGYSYILNTQNNVFEKIIGGIKGLTVLPNKTGDKFLIGEAGSSYMKISLYDSKTSRLTSTSINSIPEKCVWSTNGTFVYCGVPINPRDGAYPDVWYQGQVSFADSIEKYNILDGTKEIIGFPEEQVDFIYPSLSKEEDYLYFVNKRDGSVWTIDLKN